MARKPRCSAPGCRLVAAIKGRCARHWYRDYHREYMRRKRKLQPSKKRGRPPKPKPPKPFFLPKGPW